MANKPNHTNPILINLVRNLRKTSIDNKVKIWKTIASELERPTRSRRAVNLERISRVCKDGETIIVPGKVLASGELDKKITIAAFDFSQEALSKISQKGEAITIQELIDKNPKGSKVRIIG